MRLIDADALIKMLEAQDYSNAPDTLEEWTPQDMTKAEIFLINYAPTVDAEPVRHGHWIAHDMSTKGVPTEACSECGEWSYGRNEEYCSCCGCKMDEAVRCGDCKWFDSKRFVDGKERPVCHRYEKIVDENNFCLKGEMKDDNNN